MELRAFSPSLVELHIITPFPAARPSALTTKGRFICLIQLRALFKSVKVEYSAVGILYFFMRFLEKTLLPSSSAAAWQGPNIFKPFSSNKSTIPSDNGCSGPTIVSSIEFLTAKSISESKSDTEISTHCASLVIPAFPGAQYTFCTSGLCLIFQQSACSLPPLPITKTFIQTP